MTVFYEIRRILKNRKAQILLPSVMLAPIFILIMYLLFELTNVSIVKVRNQYALDNAAYTQVTAVSAFLNAVALINGPLPYRVLRTFDEPIKEKESLKGAGQEKFGKSEITMFDLFFRAGAVPTVADDYEWGVNPPPAPESTDWGVHFAYYPGIDDDGKEKEAEEDEKTYKYDRRAMGWENPQPKVPSDDEEIALMHKEMVRYYDVDVQGVFLSAITNYLTVYAQVYSIYKSQQYAYEQTTYHAQAFREGYYLNVDDCKRSECARQSSKQLEPFLHVPTKSFELEKAAFFATSSSGNSPMRVSLTFKEIMNMDLFLFAYLDSSAMNHLRVLGKGVKLKQTYHLPSNYFNINLEQKYKPYVRNTVVMSCGRANNNCVWPNPLPKYNVYLRP